MPLRKIDAYLLNRKKEGKKSVSINCARMIKTFFHSAGLKIEGIIGWHGIRTVLLLLISMEPAPVFPANLRG